MSKSERTKRRLTRLQQVQKEHDQRRRQEEQDERIARNLQETERRLGIRESDTTDPLDFPDRNRQYLRLRRRSKEHSD